MSYEGDLIDHYAAVRQRITRLLPPPVPPRVRIRALLPPVSTPRRTTLELIQEERHRASWVSPEPAPWDYSPEDMPVPSRDWLRILQEVCAKHRVTRNAITGSARKREIILARHEAFYRLREERHMSWPQIGRLMGGFDHTTVLYGYRQHEKRMKAASQ